MDKHVSEDPLSRRITNHSFYGRAIVKYKVIAIGSHTFSSPVLPL